MCVENYIFIEGVTRLEAARTAVIADISPVSAARTREVITNMGFTRIEMTNDGARAIDLCADINADLLLIGSVMPSLDGRSAAEHLRRMRLTRYPSIIIMAYPGLTRSAMDQLPGVETIGFPFDEATLEAAIEKTDISVRRMTEKMSASLNDVLDGLGVPEHLGRVYLVDAAFLTHEDRSFLSRLTRGLYPAVGRRAGKSAVQVERAMRHVIDTAWSVGDIDEQYRVFSGTVDAARGKPTCGAMIARLAEILHREDRA